MNQNKAAVVNSGASTHETKSASVSEVYWRSLEAMAASPEHAAALHREFPEGAFDEYLATRNEPDVTSGGLPRSRDAVSRRNFLGLMTASVAAASAAMSGCIRKPFEKIIPYKDRPEDLVPGVPNHYATASVFGGTVLGLLVESHDGRPTKVEGNPRHPLNGDASNKVGTTDVFAQASVLDLYCADRSQKPTEGGEERSSAQWKAALSALATEAKGNGGQGLALLLPYLPSPSLNRLLGEFTRALPQAKLYRHDHAWPESKATLYQALGLGDGGVLYNVERADVIVSVDSDFLGSESDWGRHARQWANRRRSDLSGTAMNRLYAIEPTFSLTGMQADNRLQLKPSQIGPFLGALAQQLATSGVSLPSGAEALTQAAGQGGDFGKWPATVAKELAGARGRSLVVAGERQPAAVQALAHAINAALGNVGATVFYHAGASAPAFGTLGALKAAVDGGQVSTLLIIDGNPVYTAPGALDFASSFAKVARRIHLGQRADETAQASNWHVPTAHYLESWADWRASDGTVSIQQPLIAPLYPAAVSILEVVAELAGSAEKTAYEIVQATWRGSLSPFDQAWRKALHTGVVPNTAVAPAAASPNWQLAASDAPSAATGTEFVFAPSRAVLDGRYSNNPWLQELPDPVTKLTWDNAVLLSPATARTLGVNAGDLLTLTVDGRTGTVAAWPTPGVAADTAVISLGYGRPQGGRFAEGAGFNVYPLLGAKGYTGAGSVAKAGGKYELASTQDHGTMMDRPIVREANFGDFKADPHFVDKREVMQKDKIKSLHTEPPRNEKYKQQWGMSIDLQSCVGCNACTIACQAENNIPVVGKSQVANGREMHWIRLDRYFVGDLENPRAVSQPLGCMHCETAPCETVCPVGATIHSPEGLNDMAYNRCIGTRYCANNCPFKVRRFNFFNYTKENDADIPLVRFQRNPDVTVRFRGVMEKCTYCVQRIQDARIRLKRDGVDVIPDGAVTPACAQACPTQAIVFGDIDNAESTVSKQKANPRNYVLLRELNVRARTSYLARVNNPNPELV